MGRVKAETGAGERGQGAENPANHSETVANNTVRAR